jgi:hypothetical protein
MLVLLEVLPDMTRSSSLAAALRSLGSGSVSWGVVVAAEAVAHSS